MIIEKAGDDDGGGEDDDCDNNSDGKKETCVCSLGLGAHAPGGRIRVALVHHRHHHRAAGGRHKPLQAQNEKGKNTASKRC